MTIFFISILSSVSFAEMHFIQRVVDARTLMLLNGEQVHLIGVEAPINNADFNKKATDYVRSLVSGSKVELEFTDALDQEGFRQGYVWFLYPREDVYKALEFKDNFKVKEIVEDWGEGNYVAFLNASIIKAGYATPKANHTNPNYASLFESIYNQENLDVLKSAANTNQIQNVQTASK